MNHLPLDTHTAPEIPKHLPCLDGVRGIAALMVMMMHYFAAVSIKGNVLMAKIAHLSGFGQTGVDLFFVLSGFLITRILLSQHGAAHYFKNFFARRALRIFPLYYFFLILTYLILPSLGAIKAVPFEQQWWFWVYLQNIPPTFFDFQTWEGSGPGHFWSLAVEEHFYLAWPFLVHFTCQRTLKRVCFAIIGFALLVRIGFYFEGISHYYFTLCRFDTLAIGALLAILERERWPFLLRPAFLAAGTGTAALILFANKWLSMKPGWLILDTLNPTFIALVFVFFIGFVAFSSSRVSLPLSWLLNSTSLRFSGRISYGLYVYHPLCFLGFHSLLGNSLPLSVDLIASFSLVFLVSTLSFYAIERPFLSLKRRFSHEPLDTSTVS